MKKFDVNDFVTIKTDSDDAKKIGIITSVVLKDGVIGYKLNYSDDIIFDADSMAKVENKYEIAEMMKSFISIVKRYNLSTFPLYIPVPIAQPLYNIGDVVECKNGNLKVITEIKANTDNKYKYSLDDNDLPPYIDQDELEYIPMSKFQEKVAAYLLKQEKETEKKEDDIKSNQLYIKYDKEKNPVEIFIDNKYRIDLRGEIKVEAIKEGDKDDSDSTGADES